MPNFEKPERISLEKEDFDQPQRYSPLVGLVVGVIVFAILMIVVFLFLGNKQGKEENTDVGSIPVAQEQCEKFVMEKLGSSGQPEFIGQKVIQDTRFPTHYQVIGRVKVEDPAVASESLGFTCDLTYSPVSKEWDSVTKIPGK